MSIIIMVIISPKNLGMLQKLLELSVSQLLLTNRVHAEYPSFYRACKGHLPDHLIEVLYFQIFAYFWHAALKPDYIESLIYRFYMS